MSDELRGGLDARLLRFRHQPSWQGAAALASALLDSERVVDALEVVESALALRPDDPELLLVEGKARLRAGDLARAQAALVRAARLAPEDKEAFRWLGELLLRRGDPHRAVKILARARQLDP
ncbi:MAG: tetratricopeptide repeat protein, partial [Myxococcota bacterium]|nr:tetratricopeptide repeat protein [Myxococcota bacterium]